MINPYHYIRFFIKRKAYHAIRRAWPIWFYILNREARRVYRENVRALNDIQKNVVERLKKDGIATVSLAQLFPEYSWHQELFSLFQKMYAEKKEAGFLQQKERKAHLTYLLGAVPVIDLQNRFLQFSFHPKILGIINGYMGMCSKLQTIELNVTKPMPRGAGAIASQRWHRDPEDKKMCKMFLYLNDVDEQAGPFIYVPQSHYGGKWRRLFPQDPPAGVYPPDGAVERVVPQEEIRVCTAPAGTLIFCDTSGLHKGGYATAKERFMFTIGFASQACVSPPKFHYSDNIKTALDGLDPVVRFALMREEVGV